MEEVKISPMKNAMNYGSLVGLALIIVSVLFYMLGVKGSGLESIIGYSVLVVGMVMGTTNYRNNMLGGYASYGQCLSSSVLIAFFASIIIAFYSFLFFSFIDPEQIDVILERIEEEMINRDMPDEQIDKIMPIYSEYVMTPVGLTIASILAYTFWGFIFSLIVSIFIKRKDDSFESNFQ